MRLFFTSTMAPLTLSTLSHHTFTPTFVDVSYFPTHAYTLATTAPLLHHTTHTLTTAPLLDGRSIVVAGVGQAIPLHRRSDSVLPVRCTYVTLY